MNDDISHLLTSWPHHPGRLNVRRIMGEDGRPKIQIRVELGLMQMELDGRPDGARPEGFDTLLDYQNDRLQRYVKETGTSGGGNAAGFVLSQDECRALREEAVQFYHRYVALFAMGDFPGVVRDTTRNLELFDLCRDYGETEFDRSVLDQFRPPAVMMRARAAAEISINSGQPKQALVVLDHGLAELRATFQEIGRSEEFESANEVQLLRGMRDALVPKLPASQKVELQERLRAALDAENYELAAILRDELRMMDD